VYGQAIEPGEAGVLREVLDLDRSPGGGLHRFGVAVDEASAAGAVLGTVVVPRRKPRYVSLISSLNSVPKIP
jgi:hypothetical protein